MSPPDLTKIKELANGSIEYEIHERKGTTDKEIGLIYGNLAEQNVVSSGYLITQVQDFCRKELKLRSDIVIQNIFKAIESTNIKFTKQIEKELVKFGTEKLISTLGELNEYLDKACKTARTKTIYLSDDFNNEVRRMSVEFEHFFEKRKKLVEESKWYNSNIIRAAVIGAIVGAIVVVIITKILEYFF